MGYKWDVDTVQRYLLKRVSSGRSLRAIDVKRESPNLYYAAKNYFGSYGAALSALFPEQADSTMQPPESVSGLEQQWTAERVLAELRSMYEQGKDLSYTAVRRKAIGKQAKRLFGSWKAAVEASGIDYIQVRRYGWGVVRAIKEDVLL